MMTVVILLLIAAAAICNALMDVTTHHFEKSVFSRRNPYIWNPSLSWKNKYNGRDPQFGRRRCFYGLFKVHVAFTDSWHFAKSLMIVLIMTAIACSYYDHHAHPDLAWYWGLIRGTIGGIIWNMTFSLFYNKIFRKK